MLYVFRCREVKSLEPNVNADNLDPQKGIRLSSKAFNTQIRVVTPGNDDLDITTKQNVTNRTLLADLPFLVLMQLVSVMVIRRHHLTCP